MTVLPSVTGKELVAALTRARHRGRYAAWAT